MKETFLVFVETPESGQLMSRGRTMKPLTQAEAEALTDDLAREYPGKKVHVFKHQEVFEAQTVVQRAAA